MIFADHSPSTAHWLPEALGEQLSEVGVATPGAIAHLKLVARPPDCLPLRFLPQPQSQHRRDRQRPGHPDAAREEQKPRLAPYRRPLQRQVS